MEATAQKEAPTAVKIRPFVGNNIRLIIDAAVVREQNEALRDSYRQRICDELGISKRYTQMLNNIVQPSLEDATTIAQILGVTVDELCMLAPEAKQ